MTRDKAATSSMRFCWPASTRTGDSAARGHRECDLAFGVVAGADALAPVLRAAASECGGL
ncbi:hypothetical protein D7D52_14490 [Nocardia yunnanensis]|uniref:Uncharacterized protein n=1 Tax=Nocardia yunnanensis TaxID=2382165 RepID=A0A386ZCH4_9NOCA|nr:hypothetical protein D7D52_14490 [Nocardia yunnanensis]